MGEKKKQKEGLLFMMTNELKEFVSLKREYTQINWKL